MNNIINLTRLSWNNFLSVKKMTLLVIVAFSISSFVNPQFLLMLMGIITYVIAYQTIAYEEMHKVNYLISYLPVTKKEYVISRYIFSILSVVIACIAFTVIYFICAKFNLSSIANIDYKINLSLGIVSSITLISILNPVIFHFGVEKGRLAMMFLFGFLVMLPSMVKDIDLISEVISKISSLNVDFLVILYTVAVLFISYLISKNIYERKEIVD